MDGIWYFNLLDSGSRRKGLLTAEAAGLRPKPQAFAHQAFADALKFGSLHALDSDHDLLDGIAVRGAGDVRKILLLNKGWLPIAVDVSCLGKLQSAPRAIISDNVVESGPGLVTLPPYSLVSFSAQP